MRFKVLFLFYAVGITAITILQLQPIFSFVFIFGLLLFTEFVVKSNSLETHIFLILVILPVLTHAVGNMLWAIIILFPLVLFKITKQSVLTPVSMWLQFKLQIALICLSIAASFLFVIDYTTTIRLLGYHVVFIGVAYVISSTINKKSCLQLLIDAIAVSVILISCIGIIQWVFGLNILVFYSHLNPNVKYMDSLRVPGPFINSLAFSHFLGVWLAFLSGVVFEKGQFRTLSFVALMFGIIVLLLTISRMAIISFGCCLFFAVLLSQRRRFSSLFVAIALLCVFAWAVISFAPQEIGSRFLETSSTSVLKRLLIWKESIKMLWDFPLGVGLGNYSEYATQFVSRSLVDFTTLNDSELLYGKIRAHPENGYLTILLEIGPIGLIAIIWSLVKLFLYGIRVYYSNINTEMRAIALGLLCAWSMVALNSITTYNFLDNRIIGQTWILFGITLAVEDTRKRLNSKHKTSSSIFRSFRHRHQKMHRIT